MQQIQQTSIHFTPQQIHLEQHQIHQYISLILQNINIDQITISAFQQKTNQINNHAEIFCQIISKKIPYKKQQQQQILEILTLCFYKMIYQQYQHLPQIELKYLNYLKQATFVTQIIMFHEKIRRFCFSLVQNGNLVESRKNLYLIMKQIQNQNDDRLQYLKWKINLCIIIYQLIFQTIKIQRLKIINLIKKFKKLKQIAKINLKSTVITFKFIIDSFISSRSDLYQFFYRELKILKDQIVDPILKQDIKKILDKCQKFSYEGVQNVLNVTNISRNNQLQFNLFKNTTKVIHNPLIHNHRLIQTTKNSPRSAHRSIKHKLSKQKSDEQFRRVDLFLNTREEIKIRSCDNTGSRINIRESLCRPFKDFKHESSYSNQKSRSFKKKEMNDTFKSQKSFLGTNGRRYRRRIEVYNKLKAQRSEITQKNLRDEKFLINHLAYERCKITKEEILLFNNNNKKQEVLHETHKFKGSCEDLYFDTLTLSFYTIFNSEYAYIQFHIQNQKFQFIIKCNIRSTYCPNPINLRIECNSNLISQFSAEDLLKHIISSTIYYEALQQKIQRKISILQLQGFQEILKDQMQINLGKSQLTKLLMTIDILQSQFFWYYGKSCYITGNRLQKRKNIQFQNLSAFAVSLGKFKSDYLSCLDEIQAIENVSSIVETCVYLSHGRMIVHKQLRLIKGKFYLEVIQISKKVYKSFCRKFKKLFFNNTMLKRKLIVLQLKRDKSIFEKKSMRFDLKQCLDEQNTFIFFMKNIVESMIQRKYLKKISKYLDKLSISDNYQYFTQHNQSKHTKYSLEIINHHLELNQIHSKPYLNQQIIHLRFLINSYCEAYKLPIKFKKISSKDHILRLNNKFCIAREIQIQNRLKILQVYKNKSRSTYKLFLYHQQPMKLTIVKTSFHNRLAFLKDQLIINLVRKQKKQKYMQKNNLVLIKNILKNQNQYYFVSLTDCESLSIWRLDYYFPSTQQHFSTFFNNKIFVEYFGNVSNNIALLKRQIEKIDIDKKKRFITKNNKKIILFKSLATMLYHQHKLQASIELITTGEGLKFILLNYNIQHISVGQVQQIRYNNKMYAFSSIVRNKMKIDAYQNIILRLYNELMAGHLTSEVIDNNYFLKE